MKVEPKYYDIIDDVFGNARYDNDDIIHILKMSINSIKPRAIAELLLDHQQNASTCIALIYNLAKAASMLASNNLNTNVTEVAVAILLVDKQKTTCFTRMEQLIEAWSSIDRDGEERRLKPILDSVNMFVLTAELSGYLKKE